MPSDQGSARSATAALRNTTISNTSRQDSSYTSTTPLSLQYIPDHLIITHFRLGIHGRAVPRHTAGFTPPRLRLRLRHPSLELSLHLATSNEPADPFASFTAVQRGFVFCLCERLGGAVVPQGVG